MKGGAAMKLAVACRQAPRIAREARTDDEAIDIVRRAIESNPTLKAMGADSLDDGEAFELTGRVMDAMRPRLLRELARRAARRGVATRGPDDEGFMDEMERRLREGEL